MSRFTTIATTAALSCLLAVASIAVGTDAPPAKHAAAPTTEDMPIYMFVLLVCDQPKLVIMVDKSGAGHPYYDVPLEEVQAMSHVLAETYGPENVGSLELGCKKQGTSVSDVK